MVEENEWHQRQGLDRVSDLKFMKTPYTNTTNISSLRICAKGERNTYIFREEDGAASQTLVLQQYPE